MIQETNNLPMKDNEEIQKILNDCLETHTKLMEAEIDNELCENNEYRNIVIKQHMNNYGKELLQKLFQA
jgi:hypothetical protein